MAFSPLSTPPNSYIPPLSSRSTSFLLSIKKEQTRRGNIKIKQVKYNKAKQILSHQWTASQTELGYLTVSHKQLLQGTQCVKMHDIFWNKPFQLSAQKEDGPIPKLTPWCLNKSTGGSVWSMQVGELVKESEMSAGGDKPGSTITAPLTEMPAALFPPF